MRLLSVLVAATALLALPATAADGKNPWTELKRDLSAVAPVAVRKTVAATTSGFWEEDFTDEAGREWRRTYWANGDWKELWTDGACRIERSQDAGRLSEKVSC